MPESSPGTSGVNDLLLLQEQFHAAQVELATERQTRQIENTRAAVEIARLQKEMSSPSPSRFRVTVLVVVLIAIGVFFSVRQNLLLTKALRVWNEHTPFAVRAPQQAAQSPYPLGTKEPQPLIAPTIGQISPLAGHSDFSAAVSRLDRALNSFPGDPRLILRAVRSTNSTAGISVCNFEWINGQPAIVLTGRDGLSLSGSLNHCAEAVEKFRSKAEKEHATAEKNEKKQPPP